jgi:hypothetical protein
VRGESVRHGTETPDWAAQVAHVRYSSERIYRKRDCGYATG